MKEALYPVVSRDNSQRSMQKQPYITGATAETMEQDVGASKAYMDEPYLQRDLDCSLAKASQSALFLQKLCWVLVLLDESDTGYSLV